MAAFDLGAGAMLVLIAVAGGAAAVGLAVAIMAWRRGWLSTPLLLSVIGLALAGGAVLTFLDQSRRDPGFGEQRALAQRADTLAARALAPNSPLACLDAPSGLTVEAACEAVVFGRPETIAAAVAYVAAKLALLSENAALRAGPKDGKALTALRRSLEADRFGIAAHVLAADHDCRADRCPAFGWIADPARLKVNMTEGTFDRMVERHAPNWPAAGERVPATSEASPSGSALPSAAAPSLPGKPVSKRFDFPSAASIPPVSIMVPEREPAEGAAATPPRAEGPGAAGKPPTPPRRPPAPGAAQRQAPAAATAPTAPAAPVPTRPAAAAPEATPEPPDGN